jgi:hypothetical protein
MKTQVQRLGLRFAKVVCGVAIAFLWPGLVWAGPVTAQDKTLFVANEAALTAQTELTQELGGAGNLAVAGTFSSAGWTVSLLGSQGGVPVSLNYTGTFDSMTNGGTFTSSGMVGGSPWTGDGSVAFTDLGPDGFGANINVQAAFQAKGKPKKPDSHTFFKFKLFTEENGYRTGVDFGVWLYTENGKIVGGPHFERSSGKYPLDTTFNGFQQVCMVDESCVDTTFNFDAGTFSGTASTVPEPASLLLLGSGVLGWSGFLRKRLFT